MKVKYLIFKCLILIILISMLPSCNQKNDVQSNKLSLYLLNNGDRTDIVAAINDFNSVSKVKVEIKNFSTGQAEEYCNILATELMSGIGPDIVLIEAGEFKSVYKAISTNVFYDINEQIKNDTSFKLDDYNKKVLNSGVFSGKRYLMPIGYNLNVFSEDKENKKDKDISFDASDWTWNYLGEICSDYIKKNKNNYVFFSGAERLFTDMLMNDIDIFVDNKNKTCNFKSAMFIELLNTYKNQIYQSFIPEDEVLSDPKFFERIVFIDESMATRTKWYSSEVNYKKNYYLMPTINGEKSVYINPCYSIGIASKCENKNEAYEFIKLMLSEKIQDKVRCMPVNYNSYFKNANFFIKNIGNGSVNVDSEEKQIDKELIKSQYNEIQEIGKCMFIDYSVMDIINLELANFLKSKISAEETAARIDEKVKLCLNE